MESPLDVTYPSWHRTDGAARTIWSGAPSFRSTPSCSSSSTHFHAQPTSQPEPGQSRKHNAQYRGDAPLPRPSVPAPSTVSTISSTRHARRPRARPRPRSTSKPNTPDNRTLCIVIPDTRPAVGENMDLVSTAASTSARDPLMQPLSQSQIKRQAQAARFRPSHPRTAAVPDSERTTSSSRTKRAAHDKETLTRTKVQAVRAPASHPHPLSKAYADIQPGESWYRPAPPKPPGKDNKRETQGRGWYVSAIGAMFGARKA